jgi:hypothetical protein
VILHRATLERLRAPLVNDEITILTGAKTRDHVVSRGEEEKYLAACTEPLRSIAAVLVDTGRRPEECFRLKWVCITFEDDGGQMLNQRGNFEGCSALDGHDEARSCYPTCTLDSGGTTAAGMGLPREEGEGGTRGSKHDLRTALGRREAKWRAAVRAL